jgi:hypothetical protein
LGFERELDRAGEGRAVEAGLGGLEEQAVGPVDDLEDVAVAVELGRGWAERDGPRATDPEVALGADDPAGIVLAVERDLACGLGEGAEDVLGRGVDDAREAHLERHARSASRSST